MARRNKVMSEQMKYELADELGVGDIARNKGFGDVSSRNCGNLVKLAIQKAKKTLTDGR